MKKKIETESTITIKIDGQEFYLTQEEARELFFSLKCSLGIVDPPSYPMRPYDPIPDDFGQPHNPIPWECPPNPDFPRVWCQFGNNVK